MIHHCNSAFRVGSTSAVGGICSLFFHAVVFAFSCLVVSQSFHWHLTSRDTSCIETQWCVTVQWLCKKKNGCLRSLLTFKITSLHCCLPLIDSVGKILRENAPVLQENQPYSIWKLSICYQKWRYFMSMENFNQLINPWVHDWLTYKTTYIITSQ